MPKGQLNRRTSPLPRGTPCRVHGCTKTTTRKGWHKLCMAHEMAQRRYGHPEQRSIRKSALDPCREAIQEIMARNPKVLWSAIWDRWHAAADTARAFLEGTVKAGKAHNRHDREAAQIVCGWADLMEPDTVFEITAAFWLYREGVGSKDVKSDASWRSLLVHFLQRECGAGRHWSRGRWKPGMKLDEVDRQKVSYKIVGPKTRERAAAYVMNSVGGAAVAVAQKELNRVTAQRQRDTAYSAAVRSIVV